MNSRIFLPGVQKHSLNERFRQFSQAMAKASGTPHAFTLGVAVVLLWAISGPLFGYSENWQLVINTGTTIITFLMVFVIQNTQARDSKELHLKLDELIRAVENARNTIINCADLSDDELQEIEVDLKQMANRRASEIRPSAPRKPASTGNGRIIQLGKD